TTFKEAATAVGPPDLVWGTPTQAGLFDTVYVPNPPVAHFGIISTSFFQTIGHGDPDILTNSFPGTQYIDSYVQTFPVISDADPSFHGTALVRVFPLDTNPQAIDNNVNFDASQLRGTLSLQVSQPDYALAEQLVSGLGYYSGGPVTSFGQTTVNLS